ncbi:MAG: secretion protein HlyD family protein [Myxococcales bacterium]|nr:secretion protein HlyD family protein [Myxococcales bacterium]
MPAAAEIAPEAPEFVGVVTSRVTKVITAEVDAPVERLAVTLGQRVRAGDTIAKLDDRQLRSDLEGAKFAERALAGEVGAAAIQARALTQKLRSERLLARAGASPMNAVRSASADASAAGASTGAAAGRYAQARNSRQQLEVMLTKTELKAPVDGVVTMIKVRDGGMASKGMPIARVFDDRDLLIRFAVPRDHRAKVAKGQRVELTVDGADGPIWATVNYISDELEPPVNFTIVEADIDDTKLRPDEIRVASNGRVRIAEATTTTTTKTASLTPGAQP